jgi:hypothetical protein
MSLFNRLSTRSPKEQRLASEWPKPTFRVLGNSVELRALSPSALSDAAQAEQRLMARK